MSEKHFKFKRSGFGGIDPQVAGETLEKIRAENDGVIRPQTVVELAKNPKHPLHPAFEWSDTKAAAKYRIAQARRLIACTVVVQHPSHRSSQARLAYVSIGTPQAGSGYVEAREAMDHEEVRKRILLDAYRQLQAWHNRFKHLKELAGTLDVVRQELDQNLPEAG